MTSLDWAHMELYWLAKGAVTAWMLDMPSSRWGVFLWPPGTRERGLLDLERRIRKFHTHDLRESVSALRFELDRFNGIVGQLCQNYKQLAVYVKRNEQKIRALDSALRLLHSGEIQK